MRAAVFDWLAARCFNLGARLTRLGHVQLVHVRVHVIGFTLVERPLAEQLAGAHIGLRRESAEVPRC